MDQETEERKGLFGNLGPVKGGKTENSIDSSGNSKNSDNGVVSETVVVLNSGETVIAGGKNLVFNSDINELGSSKNVVNQETYKSQGIVVSGKEQTNGNSSNLVNGVLLESVVLINSGETASSSGEANDLGAKIEDSRFSGKVTNPDACNGQGNGDLFHQVEKGCTGDSSNLVNTVVLETMILINSEENAGFSGGNGGLEDNGKESGSNKGIGDKSKTKFPKGDKQSCVIDVKYGGGEGEGFKNKRDGERVCRICHLSSEGLQETTAASGVGSATSMDLIQLGCGCKDELGIVHSYCAEVWFKLKGNRICEICGETAKNITGVADNRLLERIPITNNNSSTENGGGCWRGQPFCNFLMACLVIAFVLPWFFRVTMY